MKRIDIDLDLAYDLYKQHQSLRSTVDALAELGISIKRETLRSKLIAAGYEVKRSGRPKTGKALTTAERQRRFRAKRKNVKTDTQN